MFLYAVCFKAQAARKFLTCSTIHQWQQNKTIHYKKLYSNHYEYKCKLL